MRNFLGRFYLYSGYEMIIANSVLRTSLVISISHPTRARGIIFSFSLLVQNFLVPLPSFGSSEGSQSTEVISSASLSLTLSPE